MGHSGDINKLTYMSNELRITFHKRKCLYFYGTDKNKSTHFYGTEREYIVAVKFVLVHMSNSSK